VGKEEKGKKKKRGGERKGGLHECWVRTRCFRTCLHFLLGGGEKKKGGEGKKEGRWVGGPEGLCRVEQQCGPEALWRFFTERGKEGEKRRRKKKKKKEKKERNKEDATAARPGRATTRYPAESPS